jgi:hypothetical protein
MTKITTVQSAHSYGVLDPLVVERRDTKFVGGSLSDGRNIVILPQGGYTHRGGSTDNGRVRRALSPVAVTASDIALPNGGDEEDLLAGEAVTIADPAGARFVLFTIDFGAATNVLFIDVLGILAADEETDDAIVAEYHDGSDWVNFGQTAKITTEARTRRFVAGAPGHAGVTASQFRVAVDATAGDFGDVTLSGLALWSEGAQALDAVIRRYRPERGNAHQLVVTPGNIDVFEQGNWRAAIAFPATLAMLRRIKFEPKYDTILAWHVDLAPQAIKRLGSSTEWSCEPVVFENVPLVDYGGVYTNGVNEIQEVELRGIATGEDFDLAIEGETTTAIARDADGAVTAAAIKAALEALANVEAGLTVTPDATSPTEKWTVEFTGEGNASRDWLQMIGTSLSNDPDDFVRVRTTQKGKTAGEDIISATRGWPAVGRFAQQRLVMAGLKSRPNEILASLTGDPFNLNAEVDVAVAGFSWEIDGTENNEIIDLVVSTRLIFIGDEQMVFLKNRVLSAEEVPEFGVSDAPGIRAETVAVSTDNAIYYIQADGTTLRQMAYTELEQNFVAENASVLSAHLIRQPIDMARRRASGKVNSDVILLVNEADGTIVAQTVMRSQEVSGFAPWETDGAWKSVMVDHDNVAWTICERTVDGSPELRLEYLEPEKLLDEAIEKTQTLSATIAGLERFNGREIWIVGDGSVYGPHVVADGEVTIADPVAVVRAGTWIAPLAVDPDVSLEEETRGRHSRLKRVNRAVVSVMDTSSLAIAANGGPVFDVPLRSNAETVTDTPPLQDLVTGDVEAEGMHGFSRHGRLTVTQAYPGFLTVRSVTKNVAA